MIWSLPILNVNESQTSSNFKFMITSDTKHQVHKIVILEVPLIRKKGPVDIHFKLFI